MAREPDFASAATNIRALFRRLASADELPVFYDAAVAGGGQAAEPPPSHGLNEAVAAFLTDISRKLDHLISLLTTDRLAEEFPFSAQVAEISGARATLLSPEPLAPGDHLEIVFLLSQMPLRLAGVMARIEAAAPRDGNTQAVAVFTRLRQEDQEALVQFVFHEQRREIRAAKWD